MSGGQMGGQRPKLIDPFVKIAIRRIEKHDVRLFTRGAPGEKGEEVFVDDRRTVGRLQLVDVLSKDRERLAMRLEKRHSFRPAAERLKPKTARPGEAVIDHGVGKQRRDDIENRLLHPIGDGPGLVARRRQQTTPTKLARDDSHARSLAKTPCFVLKLSQMATNLCEKCVALCCRYFALEIDPPESARDYDNIRWYLMHENVVAFIEDGHWFVGVLTKCKNLLPDNRCGIYETRPRVCREFTTDNCDYHGGEYGYDKLFISADQLQAFAEQELGRSIVFKNRKPKPKLKHRKNGKRSVQLPVLGGKRG
jgi:uncharacterized protein